MSATAIGRTVSLLAALFTASASASAQDTAVTARPDSIMLADSLAPDSARARDRGPDSLTVALGSRRYATGGARQLLLGKHYRALWNARLRVEVLDLGAVAGGLTGGG